MALALTVAVVACGASAPAATAPVTTLAGAPLSTPAPVPTRTPSPTLALTPPPPISGTASVDAGDHFFSPPQLTVVVGTTVTWRIVGQNAHDITSRERLFASSALNFGGTFSYTFDRAGRFDYYCTIHEGDGMRGDVTVVARP